MNNQNEIKIVGKGLLLAILYAVFIIIVLNQTGVVNFTGGAWFISRINYLTDNLGFSINWFLAALVYYFFSFFKLKMNLRNYETHPQNEKLILFYNSSVEMCITLCFATGVIYTSIGIISAVTSSLGNLTQEQALREGSFGILSKFINNGLLTALLSTVVYGIAGYILRIVKQIFLGKSLIQFSIWLKEQQLCKYISAIEKVFREAENISQNIVTIGHEVQHMSNAIERAKIENRSGGYTPEVNNG